MLLEMGSITLGSPMALWALLSIPAIIGIHFIQQKRQRVRISTMFLLERVRSESTPGRHLDWIRSSASLWFQLLCAVLLSWVLINPRWLITDSVQRIVIVLDGSASMSAFTDEVLNQLPPALKKLESQAAHTEWVLIDSSTASQTARVELSINEIIETLRSWQPRAPHHDVGAAIERARKYRGEEGLIILVTDSARSLDAISPHGIAGVTLFAVGRPIDNAGIIGARIAQEEAGLFVETLIRNFSARSFETELIVSSAEFKSEPIALSLPPERTVMQRVLLPSNYSEALVSIGRDAFAVDDVFAVVKEESKKVNIAVDAGFAHSRFIARLIRSVPGVELSMDSGVPDIIFSDNFSDQEAASSVVFFRGAAPGSRSGIVVTESDPLVQGISFDSMVPSVFPDFKRLPDDRVLAWEGEVPFIARRSDNQLIVNIAQLSPQSSRTAPLVVLLSRFIDERRETLSKYERRNLASLSSYALVCSQNKLSDQASSLSVHMKSALSGLTTTHDFSCDAGRAWRVAAEPSLISVRQGSNKLLDAAIQFIDQHESDFSGASSLNEIPAAIEQQQVVRSRPDPLREIWILLAFICAALSFVFAAQRRAVA